MHTSNTWSRTRAKNASFVIASVRALGIELHPQSRLTQMYRVLTEGTGLIPPNDPAFEIACEAERDMQLIGFVFDQINGDCDSSDFPCLVKRMLDDSALPQDDRVQSAGRDFQ